MAKEILELDVEVFSMIVPNLGEVSCGRVVAFPIPITFETIHLPADIGDLKNIVMYTASGNSLSSDGIFDGDRLLCTKNTSLDDVKPDRIFILRVHGDEFVAKHIIFSPDGKLGLVGRHLNKVEYRVVERDQVEIVARLICSLRFHP